MDLRTPVLNLQVQTGILISIKIIHTQHKTSRRITITKPSNTMTLCTVCVSLDLHCWCTIDWQAWLLLHRLSSIKYTLRYHLFPSRQIFTPVVPVPLVCISVTPLAPVMSMSLATWTLLNHAPCSAGSAVHTHTEIFRLVERTAAE